ncbi:hypothetical protein Dip510_000428 [Elusimicrobium posterum]|uniref:CsgG/HfaB family protein n=1 Tax=Elusimicrobium posterum TaxID=3116653 RepID=UPI003C747E66
MKKILSVLTAAVLLTAGCATNTVISQKYDFSKVQRIGIMAFESPYNSFQGTENIFAKYLLQNGFVIVERAKIEQVLNEHNLSITGYLSPETTKMIGKILGVDLLLMGEITSYMPEKTTLALVETRQTRSEPVYVTQRVPQADGSVVSKTTNMGTKVTRQRDVSPSEYTINAQVGIVAKLVDVQSAEIVWIGTDTGSSSSSQNAVDSVAKKLIKSLKKEIDKQQKNAK